MNANLPRGEADAKAIDALVAELPKDYEVVERIELDEFLRDQGDYLTPDTSIQAADLLATAKCMSRAIKNRDKWAFNYHARSLGELIHSCVTTTAVELHHASITKQIQMESEE